MVDIWSSFWLILVHLLVWMVLGVFWKDKVYVDSVFAKGLQQCQHGGIRNWVDGAVLVFVLCTISTSVEFAVATRQLTSGCSLEFNLICGLELHNC